VAVSSADPTIVCALDFDGVNPCSVRSFSPDTVHEYWICDLIGRRREAARAR
jgi:hypothetical protein